MMLIAALFNTPQAQPKKSMEFQQRSTVLATYGPSSSRAILYLQNYKMK